MMSDHFRIHGDNIVECERIATLIINEVMPSAVSTHLKSPSTIAINLAFQYNGQTYSWTLDLLPGFNKSGRRRWANNIFDALKDSGSFLDETPDAIVTEVIGEDETILFAIEFCSALQAGNQAWQRSGRAFSTGRTGCPYLYIVDFVKYELDSSSRARKALRFPNPAVPFSYINFSKDTGNFVAQVYVKSEEFDKDYDQALADFDVHDFADSELSAYIVKRMCGIDTSYEEKEILRKNFNVVTFLAKSSRPANNLTVRQWKDINSSQDGIIEYSVRNVDFSFRKTITEKGHHGKSPEVLSLIDRYSVGLASRDLPIGIIPASHRAAFAHDLSRLYESFDKNIIRKIGSSHNDLILCLIKGFKPRGDDNRPDRGILPLAVMLSHTDTEILTYLYGPVLDNNFSLLTSNPKRLASSNGLWKSILALSNYVALDVPILGRQKRDEELLLDTTLLKQHYTTQLQDPRGLTREAFPSIPQEFHEDDVDTGIHYIFSHILHDVCFEGMCNPPGGDWSGMSILYGDHEVRWLSLPRVSIEVDGKRPDHVLELFGVFDKPALLAIESKEKAVDLEADVGTGLINYIIHLMDFTPSVERTVKPKTGDWHFAHYHVDPENYVIISGAAYLRSAQQSPSAVFQNSNCDMLFIMDPLPHGWSISMITNSHHAEVLKSFITRKVQEFGRRDIVIH